MKFRNPVLILLLLLALGTFISCIFQDDVAGIEGGNTGIGTVKGVALGSDGESVSGAVVRLRPSRYITGIVDTTLSKASVVNTVTGNRGEFSAELASGFTYVLEVNLNDSVAVVNQFTFDSNMDLDLQGLTLQKMGQVEGFVSVSPTPAEAVVGVGGLERSQLVSPDVGRFSFKLPPGEFILNVRSLSSEVAPFTMPMEVVSEGTLAIDSIHLEDALGKWEHSALVSWSTQGLTSISENLVNYPLLLRLNRNNFDFTQAHPTGQDLRIVSEAGQVYPFEIERWDVNAQEAEVWVKIDTLWSNSASQSMRVYWGNSLVTRMDSPGLVYSDGFVGVYHLTESAPDTLGEVIYMNSAGDVHHGSDYVQEMGKSGAIGLGQEFDGYDDRIDLGRGDPSTNDLTLSMWARWKGQTGRNQHFISKTDDITDQDSRWSFAYNVNVSDLRFESIGTGFGLDMTVVDVWEYFTVTYRQLDSTSILYMDGVQVAGPIKMVMGPNTTALMLIGNYNSGPVDGTKHEGYFGALDEVRVSDKIRSTSWIYMDYLQQNPSSTFLNWVTEK